MSASFIVQPPAGDGFKIVLTTAGTFEISGQVVSNEAGADVDHRFEGDTATNLVVIDGGLDAFQIGTTVAGAIADFRAAIIVFNEASADIDFRVESNGNANMLFVDGGVDSVGIGTGAPGSTVELDVVGTMRASVETSQYLPFGVYAVTNPITVTDSLPWMCTIGTNYTIQRWLQTYIVLTTNDASNYWTITLQYGTGATQLATFNTSAQAADTWLVNDAADLATALTSTNRWVRMICTKTNSPGNLYLAGPLVYGYPT